MSPLSSCTRTSSNDPRDIVTHKLPRGLGLVRCPALKANIITCGRNQRGRLDLSVNR
jgi:hypothetical protein